MKSYLLLLFWLLPVPVVAQKDTLIFSGWKLTLHLGSTVGVASKAISDELDKKSFGLATNSWFMNKPTIYPRNTQRPSLQIGLENAIAGRWLVKGVLANRHSSIVGMSANWGEFTISHSGTTLAALGGLYSRMHTTRLAIGPSMHVVSVQARNLIKSFSGTTFSKIGFMVEGGVRFPGRKRFFVDLQAQYLYAGKKKVGPYFFEHREYPDITVGPINPSFSHVSFTAGIGIRLSKPAGKPITRSKES